MAKKRFTDIEIWDKGWYMKLKPKHKCLMKYIFDKCDAAGCWRPNWELASVHIGETVDFVDLSNIPKDQYEVLESGKIFIPDFINFQYGQLSKNSPAHKPVFLAIEKNNLSDRLFNRVSNTLQEKDKEKDKEKEKEITGGVGGEKSDFVCYDAEKLILGNNIEFERICMSTGKTEKEVKSELRKYHLWMQKKENYPIGNIAVIAGLESWILNDYNKNKNGQQSNSSSHKLGTSDARTEKLRNLH